MPNRCDKAVPALCQRLDESGIVRRVTQGISKLVYGDPETVIEVDDGVSAPKLRSQSLACNYLSGMLDQNGKKLEGLALQTHTDTGASQLPRAQVSFKCPKLNPLRSVIRYRRCHVG